MPTKSFANVGNLQQWEYTRGTITRIVGAPHYHEEITYERYNDLCDVIVLGVEYKNVPVFYNCGSSYTQRTNGAIQGAASAFVIEKDVIVGYNRETEEMYVLCHVNDKQRCTICVVIYGEYLDIPLGPAEVGWGEVYIRTKDRDPETHQYESIWVSGISKWTSLNGVSTEEYLYGAWETTDEDLIWKFTGSDYGPAEGCTCKYIPKMNLWVFDLPKRMTDVSSEFLLEVYTPGADEEGVPQEFGETDVTYRRAFPSMTSPTQEYVTPGIYKITVPYAVTEEEEICTEILAESGTYSYFDLSSPDNQYYNEITITTTGSPYFSANFNPGEPQTKFETSHKMELSYDFNDEGEKYYFCTDNGYYLKPAWEDKGKLQYWLCEGGESPQIGEYEYTGVEEPENIQAFDWLINLELPLIDEENNTEQYDHSLVTRTAYIKMVPLACPSYTTQQTGTGATGTVT